MRYTIFSLQPAGVVAEPSISETIRSFQMREYKHYRIMRYTSLATATLNIGLTCSIILKMFFISSFSWILLLYLINFAVGLHQLKLYLKYKRKSDDLYVDILIDRKPS